MHHHRIFIFPIHSIVLCHLCIELYNCYPLLLMPIQLYSESLPVALTNTTAGAPPRPSEKPGQPPGTPRQVSGAMQQPPPGAQFLAEPAATIGSTTRGRCSNRWEHCGCHHGTRNKVPSFNWGHNRAKCPSCPHLHYIQHFKLPVVAKTV